MAFHPYPAIGAISDGERRLLVVMARAPRVPYAVGGRAELASTQGSIVAAHDAPDGTLFPLMLSRYSKGAVQLCHGYLASRPAFADQGVRQELYDRLSAIVGPLSTRTLNGFPGFSAIKLNEPAIRAGVEELLHDILARGGAV